MDDGTELVAGTEAIKAQERAGWNAKAESYDLLTGRITARMVEPLLDAAGVGPGLGVLDLGTGPGTAARRAAERGAVVTGVDIAEEMVALARRRSPEIRFLLADADDLPFPDGAFDALVGNFAINHLPRPEHAMREFARVLRPGGGLALSTWELPARNRVIGILVDAVQECGVSRSPDAPAATDPYRFADDDAFRRLLGGGRLEDVSVRSVSLSHRVVDAEELWRGMLGGSVRTAGLVMEQPPRTRRKLRVAVERLAEEYRVDGGFAIPACAKIARGRRR